jgi:hypothetical protein
VNVYVKANVTSDRLIFGQREIEQCQLHRASFTNFLSMELLWVGSRSNLIFRVEVLLNRPVWPIETPHPNIFAPGIAIRIQQQRACHSIGNAQAARITRETGEER